MSVSNFLLVLGARWSCSGCGRCMLPWRPLLHYDSINGAGRSCAYTLPSFGAIWAGSWAGHSGGALLGLLHGMRSLCRGRRLGHAIQSRIAAGCTKPRQRAALSKHIANSMAVLHVVRLENVSQSGLASRF